MGAIDSSGVAAIKQLVADGTINSAWYASETESTNSVALSSAKDSVTPASSQSKTCLPRLFLTDCQTAGRGRHGKTWQSNASSLTFSLLVDWKFQNDSASRLLSMAVGVGIAHALEFELAPLRSILKWPNDVFLGGGKVAGVLLEASIANGRVVIGVGVNVGRAPEVLDRVDANPTASLASVAGRDLPRFSLLPSLVSSILESVDEVRRGDGSSIVSEYRSRCGLSGKMITFVDDGTKRHAKCLGVDDDGGLRIEVDHQVRSVFSGEVRSLRIQSGP